MINSNITGYCQSVKEDNIIILKRNSTMHVEDDNSPLVPLTGTNEPFMFEASSFEGDRHMIRADVAEKLIRINEILKEKKLALYIRSLWRSPLHQAEMSIHKFELLKKLHPSKTISQINAIVSYFVPSEYQSMHRTGGAVEALIIDLETGQILDFGSNCGDQIELSVKCYPYYPDLSDIARKNRKLLIGIFEQEGFVVSPIEFYHFNYGNVAWATGKDLDYAIYGPIFY